MDSLIASQTIRLGKLLRTLIEYRSNLAVVPIDHPVRIHYKNEWRVIQKHPILSSEALHSAIRGDFGEAISRQLDTQQKAFLSQNGQHFFLRFMKDHTGGLLLIERLKALPEPTAWPHAIHDWLENGGYLEVDAEELYASILKAWTQEKSGLAISLERIIKYPLTSNAWHKGKNLLEQREWKRDFDTTEKAVTDALALKPQLLATNRLHFTEEQKEKLKKLAKTIPILVCQNTELIF